MNDSGVMLLLYMALIFWSVAQIWMAQVVVYPLFGHVGKRDYITYHRAYSRRIPLPVILPGFASFLTPAALYFVQLPAPRWMLLASFLSAAVALLVTVLLEIPRHARLERRGKDERTIGELIRYNWPRTIAMSFQAVLAIGICCHVFL